MSSLDDLGRALRDDAAANAPRASAINVDAVARAARARRQPRQWAVGTLSVVAVLGFGGLAVAAVTPPTMITAIDSATLESGVADAESAPLAEDGGASDATGQVDGPYVCGSAAPQYSGESVNLSSSDLPSGGLVGSEYMGTVTVVNSGSDRLTLTIPTEATGVLVRDGIIVSEPLAVDGTPSQVELAGGQKWSIPVRLSAIDCSSGSALTGDIDAVVFAEVTLSWLGERTLALVASPVTITIR